MAGAARLSPIHSLLHAMLPHAALIGWVIAYGELAIGLGTLLGLKTRIAAAAGAFLSLNLFLAVSFHSKPYFTGADIVFFFAWLPLIIAGGGSRLSADAMICSGGSEAGGDQRVTAGGGALRQCADVVRELPQGSLQGARQPSRVPSTHCPVLHQRPPQVTPVAINDLRPALGRDRIDDGGGGRRRRRGDWIPDHRRRSPRGVGGLGREGLHPFDACPEVRRAPTLVAGARTTGTLLGPATFGAGRLRGHLHHPVVGRPGHRVAVVQGDLRGLRRGMSPRGMPSGLRPVGQIAGVSVSWFGVPGGDGPGDFRTRPARSHATHHCGVDQR